MKITVESGKGGTGKTTISANLTSYIANMVSNVRERLKFRVSPN